MGRPPLRLGRPKGRPQAPFQPSHENRYPFTNWSTFAPPKWSKFTPPLTARKPKASEGLQRPPWRRLIPALAGGLALLAVAAVALHGPILNPPDPLAEAANAGDGASAKQVWTIPGRSNFQGSISPDGRFFYTSRGPKRNLLARDLITGENQALTNNAPGEYSFRPMVSPGGERLAYVQWTENEIPQLRVMRLDHSAPTVLVNDEEVPWLVPVGWSPDGSRILAVFGRKDDNNQIVLVSAEDGAVQVLKSLEWRYPLKMSFSPDGKFIAYDVPSEINKPNRDIYILHADGSRETPVVRHPSHDRFPVWTPDGKNLLFTSDRTGATGYWMIGVCTSLPTTPHLVVGRSACRVGVGPSLNRSWAQRSRPVVQAGRRAFPGDESVVD